MANSKDTDSPAADAEQGPDAAPATDRRQSAPAPMTYPYRRNELFATETSFQRDEDNLGDHWSVPWADLMMVMFVLFAALLSAKMMQPEVEIRYQARPVH